MCFLRALGPIGSVSLAALSCLAACTGQIGDSDRTGGSAATGPGVTVAPGGEVVGQAGNATAPPANNAGTASGASATGDGTTAVPSDSSAPATGGDAAVPLDCTAPVAPRAPMRRLTRFEYNNTVRDWLSVTDRPADALPGEELGNGFGNDADVLGVSRLLIDGYRTLARDIGLRLAGDTASAIALSGCDPASVGEEACRDQFVSEFGQRAFRRPLEADETAALTEVFSTGQELGGDFSSGVRAVVEVTLQLPQFLYRVEVGEVADAGLALGRPGAYEMASRLSYLLWGSAPDQPLLDAAAQGQLLTPEQVLAQAMRMIEDPRSRDVVRFFHRQLYGLGGLPSLERSAEYYPSFSPGMGKLFQEETETFVDHVVWDGAGDFQTLLTAPFSFLNGELSEFYGVAGVTGEEFVRVDLDPAERGGILTHASILSLTTPGSRTNPIVRGKWVLEKMLCYKVDDPPVGLVVKEPEPEPGLTRREQFAQHRADPSCAGCHSLLDPVGFGFENYDGVGLWRDVDNGLPIDSAGELTVTDAAGAFSTPVELAARIARSQDAKNCYVGSWLTYAYGRSESAEDACTRKALQDSFAATNGNIKQLILALTQTDAFLYRPLPVTL